MKKALVLCLVLAMVGMLVACGSGSSAPASSDATPAPSSSTAGTSGADAGSGNGGALVAGDKIAIVFATGGLGDKNLNDALYNGVVTACEPLGIEFDYAEPMDSAEYEPLLRGFADAGTYKLIVALGFSQSTSLEAVAPNYPDQKFTLIDATLDMPNVECYAWREHELAYIAGVMMAMKSQTQKLGLILAHDIYNCNMHLAGMTTGAKSVNPDIEIVYDYMGSWDDIAACKEMATAMFEDGCDIIYNNASTGALGIMEAALENDFLAINYDGNLNGNAPDNCFASMLRLSGVAITSSFDSIAAGTFGGKSVTLGAAEDAVVVDYSGSTYPLEQEIKDAAEEAYKGIADGTITVPDTKEAAGIE